MANPRRHEYRIELRWDGNLGEGTTNYRAYSRDHWLAGAGKPPLPGSSDPTFRGDRERYNPEELFLGSLSACHMLWFLHLCSERGIVVTDYRDGAEGSMTEDENGGGRFTEVVLRPRVTILETGDPAVVESLHEEAHRMCFIANSVNFPVRCEGVVETTEVSRPANQKLPF